MVFAFILRALAGEFTLTNEEPRAQVKRYIKTVTPFA